MTTNRRDVQRLTDHLRSSLGDGPFPAPGGWTHMGAVICDASFQARRNYETTIRPAAPRTANRLAGRLYRAGLPNTAWPPATSPPP
ncbi:hypothetical protein [Streptomyces sp. GF20]|uniref:hypothetical protein n=1 Tax=Streptomyces sp. GF20 TaxID=2692235 RepID=UPI001915BA93|nr:hypothetical protein [Streptomyces sp. GF20]